MIMYIAQETLQNVYELIPSSKVIFRILTQKPIKAR